VNARRAADVERRLAEAQGELEVRFGGVLAGVRLLWLSFKDWTFQREKQKLLEGMVPGIDDLTIDRATLFMKPVDTARKLEPFAGDAPEAVLSAAQRLLDAVREKIHEFVPPAMSPPSLPGRARGRAEPGSAQRSPPVRTLLLTGG
jgi:hypothetical protein